MPISHSGERAPDAHPIVDTTAPIEEAVRVAWRNMFLRAFGAPDPDDPQPEGAAGNALVALHIATAFHRLALALDAVEDHRRRFRLPPDELTYLDLIKGSMECGDPRHNAAAFYRRALTTDPSLAEAHYGFARVLMAEGDNAAALEHLNKAIELKPHPDPPPHTDLHGNAFWQKAVILEDSGDDEAALGCYRQALALVPNFGAQHVRVAHFFRRLGLIEESAEHYQRCMDYSRPPNISELVPPPLGPGEGEADIAPPEPIYTTSQGDIVTFWQGYYVAVPEPLWPVWSKKAVAQAQRGSSVAGPAERALDTLRRFFGRDQNAAFPSVKRARSIAAFEEPVDPDELLFEPR